MTKNEHTPGPWAVSSSPYESPDIVTTCGSLISTAWEEYAGPEGAAMNAHLLAAAPELLAALEALEADVRYLVEDGTLSEGALEHPSMLAARAAIAKARGEGTS